MKMGARPLLILLAAGLVLAGCGQGESLSTQAPVAEPTTRSDCERVGGTWHYDSDLFDTMAKSRPRSPRVKVRPKTTPAPHARTRTGEWECDDYPGDDDD